MRLCVWIVKFTAVRLDCWYFPVNLAKLGRAAYFKELLWASASWLVFRFFYCLEFWCHFEVSGLPACLLKRLSHLLGYYYRLESSLLTVDIIYLDDWNISFKISFQTQRILYVLDWLSQGFIALSLCIIFDAVYIKH